MATTKYIDQIGFVLKEMKYKESSKIIEIFTKDFGKISVMAKGVLRAKSNNLSTSQRFVKADYLLYKTSGDFYILKEAQVIEHYSKSNKNFDIILYKSAICDLLLRTIDITESETIFNLLDSSFYAFEKSSKNRINIFFAFLLKYISFSGFKPNLGTCPISHKKIVNEDAYFSHDLSSVISYDARLLVKDRIFISKNELLYLKKLLYTKSIELEEVDYDIDLEKMGNLIMDFCLKKLELGKFNSLEWIYKSIKK